MGQRGRPRFGGNQQGERSAVIPTLVKPQIKELLAVAAADEFRSLGGQAAKYIIEGLRRDGYIKPSRSEGI